MGTPHLHPCWGRVLKILGRAEPGRSPEQRTTGLVSGPAPHPQLGGRRCTLLPGTWRARDTEKQRARGQDDWGLGLHTPAGGRAGAHLCLLDTPVTSSGWQMHSMRPTGSTIRSLKTHRRPRPTGALGHTPASVPWGCLATLSYKAVPLPETRETCRLPGSWEGPRQSDCAAFVRLSFRNSFLPRTEAETLKPTGAALQQGRRQNILNGEHRRRAESRDKDRYIIFLDMNTNP